MLGRQKPLIVVRTHFNETNKGVRHVTLQEEKEEEEGEKEEEEEEERAEGGKKVALKIPWWQHVILAMMPSQHSSVISTKIRIDLVLFDSWRAR
jgi:CO dehydrogenase/acetyl-CoA synthase beta subunit